MAQLLDADEIEALLKSTEAEAGKQKLNPGDVIPKGERVSTKSIIRAKPKPSGRTLRDYISPLVRERDVIYNPSYEFTPPEENPLKFNPYHKRQLAVVRTIDNYNMFRKRH